MIRLYRHRCSMGAADKVVQTLLRQNHNHYSGCRSRQAVGGSLHSPPVPVVLLTAPKPGGE
jgi:hypothetical protein